MKILAAFDPGLTGAVAILTASTHTVYDLPVMGMGKQNVINGAALADLLRQEKVDYAILEQAQTMPKMNVAAQGRYMSAFGQLLGVIQALKIPYDKPVRPHKWKKDMQLSRDKEDSRRRAIELFPTLANQLARKLDHNRAEALLLGRWWWNNKKVGMET